MDADMISKQEAEDELAAMEQPFGNFLFRQQVENSAERGSIGEVNVVKKFTELAVVTTEEEIISRKVDKFIEEQGIRSVKWA